MPAGETPSPDAPPIEQVKEKMRAAWMAGDFGVVAKTIAVCAESFVERLPIAPGMRLLDVACGTGNVALPAARRGAHVTGVDIAHHLLLQARSRAQAEALDITFDEGDAEQLSYPDASFDLVTSMFGAMFAPRPSLVAAEFARVLRPGGLLAMANWNPESFSGQMFAVSARHVPGAPGLPPPVLWGDEATVRERLQANFTSIETELVPVDFDLPVNPLGAVNFFRQFFGPILVAFSRLDESGQAALSDDLEQLWAGANTASNPAEHTLVPNQYLQVTARRLG